MHFSNITDMRNIILLTKSINICFEWYYTFTFQSSWSLFVMCCKRYAPISAHSSLSSPHTVRRLLSLGAYCFSVVQSVSTFQPPMQDQSSRCELGRGRLCHGGWNVATSDNAHLSVTNEPVLSGGSQSSPYDVRRSLIYMEHSHP